MALDGESRPDVPAPTDSPNHIQRQPDTDQDSRTLGEHAADYARRGAEVIPLKPDKSPYTLHGMKDATTEPEQIRRWWRKWPNALIGHRIAPDRVLLDVDPKNGGMTTWEALEAEYGPIPVGRVHVSGRGDGGFHAWFKRPDGVKLSVGALNEWARERGCGSAVVDRDGNDTGKWIAGIDLLHHELRYTILPPSPHPDTGRPYEWQVEGEPGDLPESVVKLLTAPEAPTPTSDSHLSERQPDDGSIAGWFTDTHRFSDVLGPHGWIVVRGDGETDGSEWRHPKASNDHSATIKHGCLFVYSPNTPFEQTNEHEPHGYTGFKAWAVLNFGGDQSAAASAALELRDGPLPDLGWTPEMGDSSSGHRLRLTPLAAIKLERVHWLWQDCIPVGALALLAGPEGLGKSTLAYWLAARVTRGELPGENHGTPRGVLVCATEDSWSHTIAPRLLAHGADPQRVFRMEVEVDGAAHAQLRLPAHQDDVEAAATEVDASLLILDPLISRLDAKLDTHRDAEVRRALEPLVKMCENARIACVGLIHHSKRDTTDPLQLIMASKAFTAVARSVHTVIRDPDDESGDRRLFGTVKNNLGRSDLPVRTFTIRGWQYETDDDGPGWTGRVEWGDDVEGTIEGAIRRAASSGAATAGGAAERWLDEYMKKNGGRVNSADVFEKGDEAGHSRSTLYRARDKLGIKSEDAKVFGPRQTYWSTPSDGDDDPKSAGETYSGTIGQDQTRHPW